MKAIIKLGLTNDLVVIDDKVVIGILPLGDDILNEVKDQLMCMKAGTITELNFIVTPTVIKEYDNMFVTDGIPIGKLNCEIDYTCVLDRDDLDKFRQLASYLNIDKINIYNIFDVYKLIGQQNPCVIVSAYLGGKFFGACVDYRGVIRFNVFDDLNKEYVKEMCVGTKCSKAYSENNLALKSRIMQTYYNARDLSDDDISSAYPALVLNGIKPAYETEISGKDEPIPPEFNTVQEEISDKIETPSPIYKVEEDEDENEGFIEPKPKRKGLFRKSKSKKETMDKKRVGTTVASMLLAVAIGLTFFVNKELPAQTEDLNSRASSLQENLQPYEDEIEYLTYYKNSLDNGTKTSDVLKQISEVKVNGVLSEVGINKDTVGIFVYLADSKDIDSYKKSIGKIINVESCDSKGEVTSESTGNSITLYKYLIQGKLK